jgi:FkbM family methyltransferase
MRCYPFVNGQGRIIDQSFMRRLRFDEKTLRVKCAGGYSIEVMPNDHIGRHIYLTGQFDGSIVAVLKSLCIGGNERILDIGANVGSVSCALLHAMPKCRVVSVEPQPHVFTLLERNLRDVGGDRGKPLNVAISDSDGVGKMAVDAVNSGSSHVIDVSPAGDGQKVIDVKMVSGERLMELSGLDRVDLIKIDVEGFEDTVVRALAGTILAYQPRGVLFEHHGNLGFSDAPLRKIFTECGYRLLGIRKSLWNNALVPIDELAARGEQAHDYLAIPISRVDLR